MSQKTLVSIVMIFCGLNAIKEVVQMIQQVRVHIIIDHCSVRTYYELTTYEYMSCNYVLLQKRNYFQDITNLWEWVLYITSAVFIGPFVVGKTSSAQWQCAAIAVFLAWFNLLIFLQRYGVCSWQFIIPFLAYFWLCV